MIQNVMFRPPLAVGRLGGAATPMDSYRWREDPTVHGAARNVIEPALSLEVRPDGSLAPFLPTVLRFREGRELRPVAPFFELWATVVFGEANPPGSPAGGTVAEIPLTRALLESAGGRLDEIVFSVRVSNLKAARRTGDEANAFEASIEVRGDDFARRPLLAASPPQPGRELLVLPERPIPLGSFQVIRPIPGQVNAVDLDVLRMRFTPAAGQVYGPPSAMVGEDDSTRRRYEIVPPANRILNPAASWLRYDADYAKFSNPEPSDTYDGADQGTNQSWGVVDDTCDGVLQAEVVIGGQRHVAVARVCVGPPDYAPDRRPFVSLADDLADRDLEPAAPAELLDDEAGTQHRLADLLQRVWETASLVNLDAIRERALGDNSFVPDIAPKLGELPRTDQGSLTWPADEPYADDKVRAVSSEPHNNPDELTLTALVAMAHDRLAEEDELVDFLLNQALRLRQMIRPAYGAFDQLSPTVAADRHPDPGFRDPRITRDQMHDMRMPPYMRDETASALSLTRRQYVELMAYVEAAITPDLTGGSPAVTPLRRRVQARLQRARMADLPRAQSMDQSPGGSGT
jgi:hypothetical protein